MMRSVLFAAVFVVSVLQASAQPGATGGGERFEGLPAGWKVFSSHEFPKKSAEAVGQRYGISEVGVSNTVLAVKGERLQVNIIRCRSERDAETLHSVLVKGKPLAVLCRRVGADVVEYVCDDFRLARRAHTVLGFMPEEETYRITFTAATVDSADYMSANELSSLFLAMKKGSGAEKEREQRIAELAKRFRFGSGLSLRTRGSGDKELAFTLAPEPAGKAEAAGGDVTRFSFDALPGRNGIPCVTVTALVTSRGYHDFPCTRKPGPELLGPTPFWPSEDPEVTALAGRITEGCSTREEKVQAVLDWLMPGKNIRFYSEMMGSRYGVKKVLEQRFGQCWDFSDCFVTLCRASDVPARQVAGWLYGRCGHIWAEVFLADKGWRQVDPTMGMECDIEFIPWFTTEDGDMPIVYLTWPRIEKVVD